MANYFDNNAVQKLIIKYQQLDRESPEAQLLLAKIMKQIQKIISGIIFTHKFTMWEPYDDLFQEATEACMKSLHNFDPTFITKSGKPASAFNYFSLTAKRCLTFYTLKRRKIRQTYPIETANNIGEEQRIDDTEGVINTLEKLIGPKILKVRNGHYEPLWNLYLKFLRTYGYFNKREFFSIARTEIDDYGDLDISNQVRYFLRKLKPILREIKDNHGDQFVIS